MSYYIGFYQGLSFKFYSLLSDVEPVFSSSTTPYYSVLVSSEDGVYLVHQFAAGNNFQVKFSSTGQNATVPDPSGGLINAFSNWGPTNDMYFNPSLSGPGGSAFARYLGEHGLFS